MNEHEKAIAALDRIHGAARMGAMAIGQGPTLQPALDSLEQDADIVRDALRRKDDE